MKIFFSVVRHAEDFLMIQEASRKWKGKWFFPGGKLEPKESIEEAAIREALEEAGISIVVQGILYAEFFRKPFGNNSVHLYLSATVKSGKLKTIADEHSIKAGWKSKSEILALDLRDKVVLKIIENYSSRAALPH